MWGFAEEGFGLHQKTKGDFTLRTAHAAQFFLKETTGGEFRVYRASIRLL